MEELRAFRKSIGLTGQEFADQIKVSVSLYTKVECGDRKPSREFIAKLKNKYPQFDTNIFFADTNHIS